MVFERRIRDGCHVKELVTGMVAIRVKMRRMHEVGRNIEAIVRKRRRPMALLVVDCWRGKSPQSSS